MTLAETISIWVGIVSLVVGVTSLVVAGFAVWLSWQFYKESQGQGDRTKDAVVRIEGVVSNVNASINQIIDRVVSAFVGTPGSTAEEDIAADLVESFNELRTKVDGLAKGKDGDLRAELLGLVAENQAKTEALFSSIREARVRSLFPSSDDGAREPAVTVDRKVLKAAKSAEQGEVVLTVHREAKVITGTANLDCGDTQGGTVKIELVSLPDGAEKPGLASGFGQGDQLNIHLHGRDGRRVRPGRYVVSYDFTAKPN